MNLSLSGRQAMRLGIEQEIRDLDLSLSKVDADRLRFTVQLAECKLMSSLLASRRQIRRVSKYHLRFCQKF